jgi:hypothetical protein
MRGECGKVMVPMPARRRNQRLQSIEQLQWRERRASLTLGAWRGQGVADALCKRSVPASRPNTSSGMQQSKCVCTLSAEPNPRDGFSTVRIALFMLPCPASGMQTDVATTPRRCLSPDACVFKYCPVTIGHTVAQKKAAGHPAYTVKSTPYPSGKPVKKSSVASTRPNLTGLAKLTHLTLPSLHLRAWGSTLNGARGG